MVIISGAVEFGIVCSSSFSCTRMKYKVNEAKPLPQVLTTYKNYDEVITSRAEAVIVTTKLGKIKEVNCATAALFGYGAEELINQQISLIIDDNNFLQKAIQQHSLFEKYFQSVEVVCRTKTREKLLIAFSCSVISRTLDGTEDIVYIGRDITTRECIKQRNRAQNYVTSILSSAQNVRQAMPLILQGICETLGWEIGELWTPNVYLNASVQQHSVNLVLRCVEIWSSRAVAVREFKAITWQTTFTPSIGLPGKIWATGSPVWIKDITALCDSGRSQALTAAGLHAAFGFPIHNNNEMLGVMIFFSREVHPQTPDIMQTMADINKQIADFIKHKQTKSFHCKSPHFRNKQPENKFSVS